MANSFLAFGPVVMVMANHSCLMRLWASSGLEYLLLDSATRCESLKQVQVAVATSGVPPAPATQKNQVASLKAQGTGSNALIQAPGPAQGSAPKTLSANSHNSLASGTTPAEKIQDFLPLPLEQWPPHWLAIKNRRPLPERPIALWSYPGLGEDLVGTADKARQGMVGSIITGLGHPTGTHVFWPYQLPGKEPEPLLFWSAVAFLQPRILILLGTEGQSLLGLPTLGNTGASQVKGKIVYELPDAESLIKNKKTFTSALAYISAALKVFITP